jgi:hypothetical protein
MPVTHEGKAKDALSVVDRAVGEEPSSSYVRTMMGVAIAEALLAVNDTLGDIHDRLQERNA